ncbi:MAG: tRNA dihydrouridine(20/20a) synthase DusA [bacterium]|nr:tRNA dihydrouridine(20/20a) synthase DusA [bacterium]
MQNFKNYHRISIAPMMDCTDRYCRYFHRSLTKNALLYTEMVVARTIIEAHKRGDLSKYLAFDPFEKPLVLQLGGSDPRELAEASKIAMQYDYDEINLNVGCPSDRVQSGRFGVCLMKQPEIVADCMHAIRESVDIPLSVKTRIGVDEHDTEEFLTRFIDIVSKAGVLNFIIHARKAWLKGLNPAQNRNIPPLDYNRVYTMKNRFPDLKIELNGGIKDLQQCQSHLGQLDGVMLGRAAYENPWILSKVDSLIFNDKDPCDSREDLLRSLFQFCNKLSSTGIRLHNLARHMSGLYKGESRAKRWRIKIQELLKKDPHDAEFLNKSMEVFH